MYHIVCQGGNKEKVEIYFYRGLAEYEINTTNFEILLNCRNAANISTELGHSPFQTIFFL
jgi:hypothetical protein